MRYTGIELLVFDMKLITIKHTAQITSTFKQHFCF